MSFSIGIVGLPNVGKSTLFKALTKKQVAISPRPFTTIKPNIGVVSVPDKRLYKIANIIKPEKITPATIEFLDIAGLVKEAHKGKGLGNQFLNHIRACRAIIEVVRAFEDPQVEHVQGEVNPERDIDIIKIELLMKDLESCEKILKKSEKRKDKREETLKKIKEAILEEKSVRELDLTEEEKEQIKEFQLLSAKPIIYLLNFNKQGKFSPQSKEKYETALLKLPPTALLIDLKFEEELAEFPEKEAQQLRSGLASPLESIIISCYNILDLITFFSIAGGKETKAWTISRGAKCPEAGGKIHTDFEKKFIRAEVVPWEKLIEAQSWKGAKELGALKIVGKDYEVQDGDVIEFKI